MQLRATVFGSEGNPDSLRRAAAEANPEAIVQTLSAKTKFNAGALELIAGQTLAALKSGELLAKKPEIDFLLRVAGTAQISQAIGALGARKGADFVLVIASEGQQRLKTFGGTPLRKRTLSYEDLQLVERGALLSASRA